MSRPSLTAIETTSWLCSIECAISKQKKTCLIMCCSRCDLMEILETELSSQPTGSPLPNGDHSILHPTIANLKASRNIRLFFASSLTQLRAFLSTIPYISKEIEFLSIVGLPDLHLSAHQLNAQSLSRTLALVVDGSMNSTMEIMLVCPGKMMDHWQEAMAQPQESVWERRLPVLASSTRAGDDRAWSGRTVMMGHVFEQWCEVVKANS